MKKNYILILFLFLSSNGFLIAQTNNDDKTEVITCSEFHITRPLRDIFAENPVDENKVYEKEESGDRKNRKPQKFLFSLKDGLQYGNDSSVMQTEMGSIPYRAPLTNWAGQTASGFRPYDPSGAAGPGHYVQMINSTTFKVYNKVSGAVSLTATLGTLWSPSTPNDGDPIVMYDKAADRWFLAQFGQTGNKIYIAISTTGDPTGSYYAYTFTSPSFPDYLKFAVWADGYYMTSNQPQKVFCFERSAMLVGNASSRSIYTSFSPPQGSGFFIPMPGDAADGTLPPYGTPCPIFSYSDNGWGSGYSDAVNIYQMSVNWVPTTPTASISLAANVPTAAFDASYNSSWNDVSQPGTSQKLDGIGGVCMYRAQWKSWSGYNTILLNWGVKISTAQRSIKWCELRQNQTTGVWSLYQEGIYTPDAATRWMGGIAMDNNGSIGLCYMKSDATSIYPGLYYTGRRSCDPLGTLPVIESTVVVGTGSQTSGNRVGDYSHLVLDPDGVTFWYTSEYMGGSTGSSAARTRIFSFQIPVCGNTAAVYISQTAGTNPLCSGASATFTATPTNGGTTPVYQWKVNGVNVGSNSPVYTTSSLTNGQQVTCVMTSNLPGVTGNPATSNALTISVSPLVTPSISITITSGFNPSCAGSSVVFTATPINGGTTPSYQWKVNGSNVGSNSPTYSTSSLANGQVVSCVMTSNASCISTSTATSNSIAMTITAVVSPSVTIAQTGGTNPQCAGQSATFTATLSNGNNPTYQWKINGANVGTNSNTFSTSSLTNGQVVSCEVASLSNCSSNIVSTLGTGTSTNSTTSDLGAAYPTYYGSGRQQYLILASELTALGFSSGNISSLGFSVAGTTGNPSTLNSYTIKLATTTSTATTTTFATPSFTTVFGPVNYTPILNSVNTHNFSTPFYWNGTSNLIVDICFSNLVVGVTAYQTYQTSTSFYSTTYYQVDGSGGSTACTRTTGTRGSIRPNMVFTSSANTITATSNNITMNINASLVPAVSIAVTSGSNPSCAATSVTFTATPTNGGASPSYQWKVNGVNAGTNSSTFTTSSLTNGQSVTCVLTSNVSCAIPNTATSNGITMTIVSTASPSVSIALTTGSNPECAGASATFTATPVNGGASPAYQWKVNGVNAGTNSSTFTTSSLTNGQTVSCVLTSSAVCVSPVTALSNGITMTVNPAVTPSVSIALTSGSNPECAGTSATFTATPVNGGASPSYQWKVNGVNAGTNSFAFTTTSLTHGQTVSCVMTSSAVCVSPVTATSNGITMTVNAVVTPSVSIALTSGSNPECAGASATFTASPTNGGASPSYQWKVNGVNAGTNSFAFTTTSLTHGQTVSCVMTSSAVCVSPVTATSNGITMTVNAVVTPSVSIALTTGSNPECAGASATFTASPTNGGASPSYQWKVDGVNAGINSSTFTTSSLTNGQIVTCVLTSNAACVSPATATSNGITMTVNAAVTPSVSIVLTSGVNPQCAGTSSTFTATAVNGGVSPSYLWKIGATTVGTNSSVFTNSSLSNGDVVTCVMTSDASCVTGNPATSNALTITVNPNLPSSVIISANPGTTICTGGSVTFTATPLNGGASPAYVWKNGVTSVGTNSSTYTSSLFTDGDVITCVMTSNATCAIGSPSTSNALTMIVNNAPIVNTFSPISGGPGTQVIIEGSGFSGTSAVTFDGLAASFTVSNNGEIIATVPALATTGLINVTTQCGNINSSNDFTISNNLVTLNLKLFLEGFYQPGPGGGGMNDNYGNGGILKMLGYTTNANDLDTIFVSAMNAGTYAEVNRKPCILQLDGTASVTFDPIVNAGTAYYIKVNHRNSIETWSANPVLLTSLYDFTTSQSQAYGGNMIDVGTPNSQPPVWAFYSGDISDAGTGIVGIQDDIIEAQDFVDMENAVYQILIGYFPQDITGDGIVESLDYTIEDNNVSSVIFSFHP